MIKKCFQQVGERAFGLSSFSASKGQNLKTTTKHKLKGQTSNKHRHIESPKTSAFRCAPSEERWRRPWWWRQDTWPQHLRWGGGFEFGWPVPDGAADVIRHGYGPMGSNSKGPFLRWLPPNCSLLVMTMGLLRTVDVCGVMVLDGASNSPTRISSSSSCVMGISHGLPGYSQTCGCWNKRAIHWRDVANQIHKL